MSEYEQAIRPVKEVRDMASAADHGPPISTFPTLSTPWHGTNTLSRLLQRLFGQLLGQGTVSQLLEVGVGTGPNLPYYRQLGSSAAQPQGLKVTGLDPNISMQQYAELSAQQAGLQDFAFVQGSAEQMPFDDGSFDAAVLTLVSRVCASPAS